MDAILEPTILLFVLLNPFMLTVYLHDMLEPLPPRIARLVLIRGAVTAGIVFVAFAWTGDALFTSVLQVRFASFLIFGGIIFLIIGTRFVLAGSRAKADLVGGEPQHIAGSIAMPFMIGPGTVSASVLAGEQAGRATATVSIALAVSATVVVVLLIRAVEHRVAARYAAFVERYSAVVGRISALVIGTIATEMILDGIELWMGRT